ncbi:aspartate aminotransferase family protein [Archangium violaceum]|uniref:aspartate aminotransferase family protein n=1 Tax=Archangium violaceum TaxID=83451 RepID=UPI001EF4A05D|nr:aspartate aminotransferase family protein [Archangium violaceum]
MGNAAKSVVQDGEKFVQRDVRKNIYYDVSDLVMERGQGVYLYDSDGKEYIDCASATFNLILGYTNHEVLSAVKKQADSLVHVTSSFQTGPINEVVQRLVDLAPKNLTKVHPKVCSGSTANEGAIKMAQNFNGGRDVISLFRSHLGQTMMMASLSGNAFRKEPFPNLFPGGIQVPDPYCYRCFYKQKPETCNFLCVERINDFIDYGSTGKVACMVVEPISGNGGNIMPPPGYFQALKKLCDERGIALIFDEIQTGFGRTGHMFAADYYGVQPHIMTVAKGLGGTGFQIAAIMTEEKYGGLEGHHHSFTYGANVLAAAAAAKTLEIVARPGFLGNVRVVGEYIMGRLHKMKERFSFIGDVRGAGLMIGIEIVDQDGEPDVALTNKIAKSGMHYGIILRTSRYGFGNVFKIRPPLIITPDEAVKLCDQLEKCLAEVKK